MPPFRKIYLNEYFFLRDKTFCVTMKCDIYNDNINEEWIIQMVKRYKAKRIILKHNMRNTETIMSLSNCFTERIVSKKKELPKADVIPKKNIIGPMCYHYINIHNLDDKLLARAAIRKYFPGQHESKLVLLDCGIRGTQSDLYTSLKKYLSRDRKIVYLSGADDEKQIGEVKEYLENQEGILITDRMSFHGAQARNIILIADHRLNRDFNLRNMILRTMSFAIIIHKDEKQSVPGLVRDDNLHEYIHPGNTEQLFCNNKEQEHRSNCHLPLKE